MAPPVMLGQRISLNLITMPDAFTVCLFDRIKRKWHRKQVSTLEEAIELAEAHDAGAEVWQAGDRVYVAGKAA
jgi:hypothetical protein